MTENKVESRGQVDADEVTTAYKAVVSYTKHVQVEKIRLVNYI
jgi:hypothetical protein